MLNIQKLLSLNACNSIKHITIIVFVYITYNRTVRFIGKFFSVTLAANHYTKQSIFLTGASFPHAASVPVLQLHLMNLRMLSGRGNISGITGWHMPFLTSHHYFVISVSFSSTFFHIFICRYTRKLWKKAALRRWWQGSWINFLFRFPNNV